MEYHHLALPCTLFSEFFQNGLDRKSTSEGMSAAFGALLPELIIRIVGGHRFRM